MIELYMAGIAPQAFPKFGKADGTHG